MSSERYYPDLETMPIPKSYCADGFEPDPVASMMRVLETDPDTQLLHLAHEAWNALAVLELYLRSEEHE